MVGNRLEGAQERAGRYFPLASGWPAAEVARIEDESIVFKPPDPPKRLVERRALIGLLDRFVSLSSDDAIVAFAREFGALELCQDHDLPHLHQPAWVSWGSLKAANGCDPAWRESLTQWRRWIDKFLAVYRIMKVLRQSPPNWPTLDDWAAADVVVHGFQPGVPAAVYSRLRATAPKEWISEGGEAFQVAGDLDKAIDIESHTVNEADRVAWLVEQRRLVAGVVNQLIEMSGLRPVLTWDTARSAGIQTGWLYNSGLFGALAMQLAIVATNDSDRFECAICHDTWTPARLPPSGRKRYFCPLCKNNRLARRLLDREAYEKKKKNSAEKALSRQSSSKSERRKRGEKS